MLVKTTKTNCVRLCAFKPAGLVENGKGVAKKAKDGLPYTGLLYANGPKAVSNKNGTKREDLTAQNTG